MEAHNDERPFADQVRMPDSDTETVGAVSDVSAHAPTVEAEVVAPVEEVTISPVLRDAFRYLDIVDVSNIFQRRASVMRSPPKFLCGAFRPAVRVALQEIVRGAERVDERAQCRGWKLFLLLPRMLLFRPPRGGNIPKQRLVDRFTAFSQGDSELLLRESEGCDGAASRGFQRRRRNQIDTPERRADRAQSLIMIGEVSAGRQALEGAPLAHALWTSCKIQCGGQPLHMPRCPTHSSTTGPRWHLRWTRISS